MTSLLFFMYPLSCIVVPCLLYVLIETFVFRQKTTVSHLLWVFTFLIYIYMVLETTGIGTIWEIGLYPGMKFEDEVNLIPFCYGIELSMILNIIMFMPFGFLLPLLWKEYKGLGKTALTGFLFSVGIELCQLFNRRVSDVNDLIANTLGAVFGWLLWYGFSRLVRLRYGKRNTGFGAGEAAALLILSLAGQFFLYNWRWMLQIAA